jgi:hypothetical protein
MLFMVIEYFKENDPTPVGERFKREGRMLPEGLVHHGSWIDEEGTTCFQLMEAETAGALQLWMERWADLVDFEIVQVLPSLEFWARSATASSQ